MADTKIVNCSPILYKSQFDGVPQDEHIFHSFITLMPHSYTSLGLFQYSEHTILRRLQTSTNTTNIEEDFHSSYDNSSFYFRIKESIGTTLRLCNNL